MKIRAIELTNIRRFAGHTARIEGMGDGIVVLCEPNEFGKSTFFDALHALFFERHRGTRAGVKTLQPHAGGAPEVAIDVDLPDGRFRIEKRWLSRPTARIRQEGRIVAQDDEAEAWIDAMTGRGLSAPSGLLWVRQGLLGMEPEGSSASDRTERERALSARRDLVSSVAGEIAMMTGGRRLDAVMARVEDALVRLATTTGRAKVGGEWARAEAEAEALRTQEADLSAKASRLSGELARRAEVQRHMRDLDDPDLDRRRKEALASARKAQAEAEAHGEMLRDAQRTLALARVTTENTRAAIERLETLSERVRQAERALSIARNEAAGHETRADVLAIADRDTATALIQAQDRTRAVRDRLMAAQRARLAQAARGRVEQLAHSLAQAEELRARLEADRAQRALLVVTPRTLAAAEQARDEHDRLAAQRLAKSVTLHLHYTGAVRVQEEGRPLSEGAHPISTPRSLTLPGIGTLRIDPGVMADRDNGVLERAAANLATRLAACGAQTMAEARGKLIEAQRLDEALRGTEALLAQLTPDGLEALQQAHAKALAEAGGAVTDPGEDPATLEAALAAALETENGCRDAATEAHAAFVGATEARAGARSTLASAEQAFEAASTEAGDLSKLAARLQAMRDDQVVQGARLAEAQADCNRLEQAAPDREMISAALARAHSVVTQAQTSRERLREELAMLNGSIGTLAEQGIEEQLDEVRGRLAEAGARAARYATEVAALARLRGALEEARRSAREAYLQPVVRELQPLLSAIHPGATLEIDDGTLLPAALTRDGRAETLDILSGGTREQVAILTRLAFARLFARTGRSVPVILDDALVYSDDDRIEAMFTALHRVAQDQQVLVLTCRQRAFAALGGERARVTVVPV